MTSDAWEKSQGLRCTSCGQEYFRGRDSLCYPCWEKKKDNECELRDPGEMLMFLPESVVRSIVRPSRAEK